MGVHLAKRFTDTGKWDKAWFRKLKPHMKCAWIFLVDRCDHAGIWNVDLDALEFFVGERVGIEDLKTNFKIRVIDEDKVFIPSFVDFQYGEVLNPDNNAHRGVISRLKKLGLHEPLSDPSLRAQDKDKDKEKEKDQEKEKKPKFDFDRLYKKYPRHEGAKKGLEHCRAKIKTEEQYNELEKGIDGYVAAKKGSEKQFILLFSTFMSEERWRDYLPDPNAPPARKTARDVNVSELFGGQ